MINLRNDLATLHGRTVVVTAANGTPVSIGRVSVKPIDNESRASPVTITFETETMRCELGVPAEKIEALAQSSAGEHLAYRLPPCDAFKFGDLPSPPTQTPQEPIIETFPLPERPLVPTAVLPIARKSARAITADNLKKTGAAVDRLLKNAR